MSYETDHNVRPRVNDGGITGDHMVDALETILGLSPNSAAPTEPTSDRIHSLFGLLNQRIESQVEEVERAEAAAVQGMSQSFIDSLDRVPRKKLQPGEDCAVCGTDFTANEFPLVVSLPCPGHHRFDLECVTPWLKRKPTCPMCRFDFIRKKVLPVDDDSEDMDDFYS